MDINSILPLLLGNNNGMDKAKLFSMLTGGKSEAPSPMPDVNNLSSIMQMLTKKKAHSKAMGLSTITSFAPADILGALVKLLEV